MGKKERIVESMRLVEQNTRKWNVIRSELPQGVHVHFKYQIDGIVETLLDGKVICAGSLIARFVKALGELSPNDKKVYEKTIKDVSQAVTELKSIKFN